MSKGRFDDLEDKAYYSSEREIKSRVVLEYDLPQIRRDDDGTRAITITSISPAQSTFSNLDEVVDQSIVKSRNFGSFEKNQFKLDGNFYLPYRNIPEGTIVNWGSNYVSEDIPSYKNKPLELTLEIKNKLILDPVNAFTIVFDDNYPKSISISFIDNKNYFNGKGLVNNDFEVVNGTLVEKTETSLTLKPSASGCYAKITPLLSDTSETNKSYIEKFGTEVESNTTYHLYAKKSNNRRTLTWIYYFDKNYNIIGSPDSFVSTTNIINVDIEIPESCKYICYNFVIATSSTSQTKFSDIEISREEYFKKEINDNDNSTIYFELDNPINFANSNSNVTTVSISADTWALDDTDLINRRRIRLKKILFGLVEEYNDTEILSMNIINQKKKFCEEIPENECEFTIGNYSGEFDLLNEKGKKRHLSKRTTIIPWIGINTEDGTKYENRGTFFLDNWKNNDDETVTFTGKDIFSVIKNAVLVENGQSGLFDETTKGYYMNYIFPFPTLNVPKISKQMMDYMTQFLAGVFTYILKRRIYFAWNRDNLKDNNYCGSWTISTDQTKSKNVLEFLQKLAVASGCVLDTNMYIDESIPDYFEISLLPIEKYYNEYIYTDSFICRDVITLDDMTSEPVVTKIDKINKVKVTQTNVFQGDNELPSDYTETKITQVLNQDYEIIPIFFDSPTVIINKEDLKNNYNIASSNTIFITDTQGAGYWQENYYMIFLQTKLKKGQTYTQTLKVAQVSKPEISAEYTNKEDSKIPDVTLEINNEIIPWLHTGFGRANCKKMAQYYLDNATQYKVNFEFFGNARVKPGDTIKVETRYGYIYVWVEKTEFNYDGGLTCKVEGVSTGGLINE